MDRISEYIALIMGVILIGAAIGTGFRGEITSSGGDYTDPVTSTRKDDPKDFWFLVISMAVAGLFFTTMSLLNLLE